jgi:hypothetical protein
MYYQKCMTLFYELSYCNSCGLLVVQYVACKNPEMEDCSKIACVFIEVNEELLAGELLTWTQVSVLLVTLVL